MKTLAEQLSQYATCHRDRRNIATHYFGIPLILLAVTALLSRPVLPVDGWPLSPSVPVAAAVMLYYLVLDLRFGLAMAVVMAASLAAGAWVAALSTPLWLGSSLGALAVGFIAQLVGHRYEGKKPAFVDDLMGFLVGPLFLVAEAAFLIGLRPRLRAQVESFAGPTRPHISARLGPRLTTPR